MRFGFRNRRIKRAYFSKRRPRYCWLVVDHYIRLDARELRDLSDLGVSGPEGTITVKHGKSTVYGIYGSP